MPEALLTEDQTGGLFEGKFWVDGVTSISEEDGDYYLWVYATVHSPQLPTESELSIFG